MKKRKKKTKYFSSKTKFFALFLLFSLLFQNLASIPMTKAYFNDSEESADNLFTAGTLDISLTKIKDFSEKINAENFASSTIEIKNQGNLDFSYKIKASSTDTDCIGLGLKAYKYDQASSFYEGALLDFEESDLDFEKIYFEVFASNTSAISGGICDFDFEFIAYQVELDETKGFVDNEKISNSVEKRKDIVLNEFLPKLNSNQEEWIEIYNNKDEDVDLSDYYLVDGSYDETKPNSNRINIEPCRTMNATTTIKAKGWLVVYVRVDKDCNSHKFNLNDGGDTIELYKTGESQPVDRVSYPLNNEDVERGKTYARIPDGTGDWVDPIPTPGAPNTLKTSMEYLLWWNANMVSDPEAEILSAKANNNSVEERTSSENSSNERTEESGCPTPGAPGVGHPDGGSETEPEEKTEETKESTTEGSDETMSDSTEKSGETKEPTYAESSDEANEPSSTEESKDSNNSSEEPVSTEGSDETKEQAFTEEQSSQNDSSELNSNIGIENEEATEIETTQTSKEDNSDETAPDSSPQKEESEQEKSDDNIE